MSQYGYGYGSSQPPPPYYQSAHPHSTAQYQGSEMTGHQAPEATPHESYELNRNTIPGLGLNYAGSTAGWQQGHWPNAPSDMPPAGSDRHPVYNGQTAANRPNRYNKPSPEDDMVEEGELSEEQLEDIYEPREDAVSGYGQVSLTNKTVTGNTSRQVSAPQAMAMEQAWETDHVGRERSGSYSPHLSPTEINSKDPDTVDFDSNGKGVVHNFHAVNRASHKSQGVPFRSSHPASSRPQLTEYHVESTSQVEFDDPVIAAKERAKQAILRLWPLEVRYKNYLDEGIDKSLLGGLFKDLGLDTGDEAETAATPKCAAQPAPPEPSSALEAVTNRSVPKATEKQGDARTTKDRSEERKDRIARLLAARGTKPVTPAPQTSGNKPPEVSVTKVSSKEQTTKLPHLPPKPDAKIQSDKSKLLQQKMEALKKAREAATKQGAGPQNSAMPARQEEQPAPLMARPAVTNPPTETAPSPMTQPSSTTEQPDLLNSTSIPGLFLSSGQQNAAPLHNHRKRPIAADLNEASSAELNKRPFGQFRESRPFLIDVSDDEDDAEMEIDSPEQRPASIHRPITPSTRTTSFRDHPALPDKAGCFLNTSSPSRVSTPANATGGNGLYDLESMNKKIEDMKRKIAEAEARKKAKQLSQDASQSQSQAQSKEGSADISSNTEAPVAAPLPTETQDLVKDSTERTDAARTPIGPKLKSPTSQQPHRGRAESEKLSLLEAHRKEQALKLQMLRSEIARVEREIQESLQEEERLKSETGVDNDIDQNDVSTEDIAEPSTASRSSASPTRADEESVSTAAVAPESGDKRPLPDSKNTYSNQEHNEEPADVNSDASRNSITSVDEIIQEDADMSDEADQDVAMEEDSSSSDEDEGSGADDTDGYEPPELIGEPSTHSPTEASENSREGPIEGSILEANDTDVQDISTTSPVTQPISTDLGDSQSESGREVERSRDTPVSSEPHSTFTPFESSLKYFRAFRFHSNFQDSVPGGLRSMTYSNTIDVGKEVCPDELVGETCPRGGQCQFQHFDRMQAPDDQILLQLGAYGNYEGEQQQQYITGLRELLTDFRSRGVKDFRSISQGIIDYRARFHGDKTKVLPLGNVSI